MSGVAVGLGGDGEGDEQEETTGTESSAPEDPLTRSRSEYILECGLSPESLVGSFFHRLDDQGQIIWKGLVVGEVEPRSAPDAGPVYLVELRVAPEVPATYQRLVRWEHIVEGNWRFYDSEEWLEQQERLLRAPESEADSGSEAEGKREERLEAARQRRRRTTQ